MKYLNSQDIRNRPANISDIKPYKTTQEIIFSNIFTFFNAINLALALLVATFGGLTKFSWWFFFCL